MWNRLRYSQLQERAVPLGRDPGNLRPEYPGRLPWSGPQRDPGEVQGRANVRCILEVGHVLRHRKGVDHVSVSAAQAQARLVLVRPNLLDGRILERALAG